ncbi:MAG: hypothetical protein K1X52_07720 [Pyrinomonadaceae bacterium]|nr:hypothetical protein [Pyrinomonadaceae bacterium]
MKVGSLLRGAFSLAVIFVICQSGVAQEPASGYACKGQPLGVFRQITGARYDLSPEYDSAQWPNQESDLREGRWTLDPLDRVDPAYKISLYRDPTFTADSRCTTILKVVGKLISPQGLIFAFDSATYDFSVRKLKFRTIERNGVVFEGEIQFFPKPQFVKGGYESGVGKLKILGRQFGVVTIDIHI